MATEIDKVETRKRLAPRHEPYWTRSSAGCHIGFQKLTSTSSGSWVAKYRDPDSGKRSKISLGDFETLPASQRFDAACQTARKKFEHFDRGGSALPVTVKQACANYVKHLADNGRQATSKHAAGRFSAGSKVRSWRASRCRSSSPAISRRGA